MIKKILTAAVILGASSQWQFVAIGMVEDWKLVGTGGKLAQIRLAATFFHLKIIYSKMKINFNRYLKKSMTIFWILYAQKPALMQCTAG